MADVKISALPAAGAITGSELVPIVQGGVTSKSTVDGIKNGAVKVYRALLVQSGTNNPTTEILENTLGGTLVWVRNDVGEYVGSLTGAFPSQAKTAIICGQETFGQISGEWNNANNVTVTTVDITTLSKADDYLDHTFVQILVYP